MKDFPHLPDSEFPGIDTVNPYQVANAVDYAAEYSETQMRITVCSVPWDMGEAHIGARVIEGVGNVVKFESEAARDAWFDALESGTDCIRAETLYKEFANNTDSLYVDIPFDLMGAYNYVEVVYPDGSEPLAGEAPVKRWYYFIRSVEREANETTKLVLIFDVWQTFCYRMTVQGLYLQQGHWPVAETDADAYLADPASNSEYLTTPDVSFGEITMAASTSAVTLNGDVVACIATTGDVSASAVWGSVGGSDWSVPACYNATVQGAPGPSCFAMEPGNLVTFLNAVEAGYPQFLQTVQGVFFAPDELVQRGSSFEFFGVSVFYIVPQASSVTLVDFAKSQFGYPDKYADLAKLYTYPYAALDVYSEDGAATRVNVEDCAGTLELNAALQLTWPWLAVDAHIDGIGGSAASGTVTFRNLSQHTFEYAGLWYQKLMRWDIPVYEVVQSAGTANFSTYWDRQQTLTAAANAQDSAEASANLGVTNAGVQTTGNTAINARSNSAAIADSNLGNDLNQALQAWNAGASRAATAIENEGEQLQAAVGAAAGVVGSATSGAMSGGVVGAVGGLIQGAISGGASMANTAISVNMASSKTESQISFTQAEVDATNQNNTDKVGNQTDANTDNTATTNSVTTATAANTAAVGVANAAREYGTQSSAVANQVAGAKLGAPRTYGSASNGQTGALRPMAAFATVVTQSPAAIAQAGDAFLRYGYALERWIEFDGDFCPMPKFCYWKCSDMWLQSSTIPDAYLDQIRFLLFGGVTVWKNPDDIGHTSIYNNK